MVAPVAPAAARVEDAADYRQRPCADDPAETADAAFELREARVDAAMHGMRLDKALVTLAGEFSRNHLQSLIEAGHLCIDGQVVALPSRKLRAGQQLRLELVPTEESRAFRAQPLALDIVYEDVRKCDWATAGRLASDPKV